MSNHLKYFPVNWIDGMKISKDHFIAQDNAWRDALNDTASLAVSPIRFGLLPLSDDQKNFNVKISVDNQDTLRVTILACHAITSGGIRIALPGASLNATQSDGIPAASFQVTAKTAGAWRVILFANSFERIVAGNPDTSESPPRYPHILPAYKIEVVTETEYVKYAYHPYALTIAKLSVNGNNVKEEKDYIPPCFSVSASEDLLSLYAEFDKFYGKLEMHCTQIVQKIFQRKQQNEISELVMFLCDRVMLYLSQVITAMRWTIVHESPALLFAGITGLARVMKNSIDMRIGSGKEEMINYFTAWCELKQGELESMLTGMANIRYDNNDINKNINQVTLFVKTTAKLFETLSKLEFIGDKPRGKIFVNEDRTNVNEKSGQQPKRKFFEKD